MSEYEIQEKGTELMPINAGWQTELQACEVGAPSENAYHYFVTKTTSSAAIVWAAQMSNGLTVTMYVKQMYGGTWGN